MKNLMTLGLPSCLTGSIAPNNVQPQTMKFNKQYFLTLKTF